MYVYVYVIYIHVSLYVRVQIQGRVHGPGAYDPYGATQPITNARPQYRAVRVTADRPVRKTMPYQTHALKPKQSRIH